MFLLDEVDAVDDAVSALVTAEVVGFEGCSDAVITSSLWEVERDRVRLDAAQTVLAGEWLSRDLHRADGSRSAGARMARDFGCSRDSADRLARRARKLRSMPVTAAAFARGELSTDNVDALCEANGRKRVAAFAEAEQRLVSDAKRLEFADLRGVLATWKHAADVAASAERAQRDVDGSHFGAVSSYQGTVDLRGRLDPVRGAIVQSEIDRLERHLREQDWAEARAAHGDDATSLHLRRTPAQRRAAALVLMAQRSRAMAPGSTACRPLFTVLIDHQTAKQVCELANGTVIAPSALASFITDADLERVVFGPAGRVLDVGRRSRFFRGGLRRAIEVRDRHCTFPGCREAAETCDIDHIIEWTDGGTTDQDNGRLRCGPHNRQRPGRTDPGSGQPDDHDPPPDDDERCGDPPPGDTWDDPPLDGPDAGGPPARDRPGSDPPAHGPPA